MALTIFTPTTLISSKPSSSSLLSNKKWTNCCYSSTCSVLPFKTSKFGVVNVTPLGLCPFSSWTGLRQMSFSISTKSINPERKGRRCKQNGVYASLFGVGAPEALVIGVVALLVFGPKGLAEVARNLGKTLREFQPTIKELQDVSREFRSTLEREIGLDDISVNTYNSNITKRTSTPEDSGVVPDLNGGSPPNRAYTSEEYLKITEEQLKAAASQQPGQTSPPSEDQPQSQNEPQDGGSPPNRAYTSEEYLKITEEQLKAAASQQPGQTSPPSEDQPQSQNEPQGSVEEVAATIPPSSASEKES